MTRAPGWDSWFLFLVDFGECGDYHARVLDAWLSGLGAGVGPKYLRFAHVCREPDEFWAFYLFTINILYSRGVHRRACVDGVNFRGRRKLVSNGTFQNALLGLLHILGHHKLDHARLIWLLDWVQLELLQFHFIFAGFVLLESANLRVAHLLRLWLLVFYHLVLPKIDLTIALIPASDLLLRDSVYFLEVGEV